MLSLTKYCRYNTLYFSVTNILKEKSTVGCHNIREEGGDLPVSSGKCDKLLFSAPAPHFYKNHHQLTEYT